MEKLALLGGTPIMQDKAPENLLKWPIMTQEDYDAAMDVVYNNSFSGTDITIKFQNEFAQWQGVKYALAFTNGTLSLAAAMFGIGLGAGDEIICPTKTYWGSIAQTVNFGATPVFCNINEKLVIDANDIERCISPRTKAIMVVHYMSYPCDMDPIMEIARKYNLYVIEDVSHAQGGLYKGRKLGTIGDVGAMSLMSGKTFAAGELGMLVTDNQRIYERALAYGHYERNNAENITESEELKPYYHIALGGVKGRANQLCSALGRVQLKYYDERCEEVRRAMNYFYDRLEGLPGIHTIRVDEAEGSTMAGWYHPHAIYHPEELHGLSVQKFCEALRAECTSFGGFAWSGANYCLHTHALFQTFDFRNEGKPTRIAYNEYDVRQDDDKCKPSEEIQCFSFPRFVTFNKEWIDNFVKVVRKVIDNHELLLETDKDRIREGRWYGTTNE